MNRWRLAIGLGLACGSLVLALVAPVLAPPQATELQLLRDPLVTGVAPDIQP